MSETEVIDTSFMTKDQQRVYQKILNEYSNVEKYEKMYKEVSVKPVEGSDKVVVTFTNSRRNMVEIYLPAKIDEDTRSYTYYGPGGLGNNQRGANGCYVIDNAIENAISNKNNAIFCMTSSDDKEEFGLNSIETMLGENGFNSNVSMGWSQGGYTTYNSTLDKIRNNPNLDPQTMILLETQYNGSSLDTSEENLQLFKKMEQL